VSDIGPGTFERVHEKQEHALGLHKMAISQQIYRLKDATFIQVVCVITKQILDIFQDIKQWE